MYDDAAAAAFAQSPSELEEPKPRRTVRIATAMYRIWDVDDTRSHFKADFGLRVAWELSAQGPDADDLVAASKRGVPWVKFLNAVEPKDGNIPFLPAEGKHPTVTTDERNGEGWVCFYARYVGEFHEYMDLQRFPFDQQVFRIYISTTRDDIRFARDPHVKSEIHPFVCEGWRPWITEPRGDNIQKHSKYMLDRTVSGSDGFFSESVFVNDDDDQAAQTLSPRYIRDQHFSQMMVHVPMRRDVTRPYLLTIIGPVFLLTLLSCGALLYNPSSDAVGLPADPGTRVNVAFSVLLTLVALKITTADWLPKLSTPTLLDYYLFAAFFLVWLICAKTVLAPRQEPSVVWAALLGGVWLLFTIFVACQWRGGHSWERSFEHVQKLRYM